MEAPVLFKNLDADSGCLADSQRLLSQNRRHRSSYPSTCHHDSQKEEDCDIGGPPEPHTRHIC